MPHIGARLKKARRNAGMTQQELAAECAVSRAAVAQWEANITRPSVAHLQVAANALGVWMSWVTGEGHPAGVEDAPAHFESRPRELPVIDYVRAGNWDTVTDAYPRGAGMARIAVDRAVGDNAFALFVRGDSMSPEYREGDCVIVEPAVDPRPGDHVVAKLDNEEEATLKKYRPRGTDAEGVPIIELVPLNDDWPTLRIDATHPGRIIGTVVEHRHYRRP